MECPVAASDGWGGAEDSMTGRQVADTINESNMLKSPLTPKKLAPILAHLGVKSEARHNQNVYFGLSAIGEG